jgi:hypothetical protein
MGKRDYEFELIFDDLVERFLNEGKDLDHIEKILMDEVMRAVEERREDFEEDGV